jgi:uncharacterized protein DUF4157
MLQRRAAAPLQRAPTGEEDTGVVPPIVHDVLRTPGQPLELRTRAFMEARFGHDFSHVRVHTESRAADSAKAIHARAYTLGSDVVFANGQYAPQTHEGRALPTHELTHVRQQRAGLSQSIQRAPDDAGQPATRVAGAPVVLQRKIDSAACLAQTDEILPSIGLVATIDRELTLIDTLGSEYDPLKKKIRANTEARKFVCYAGVPAVLALWDTRTVAGALDVPAAHAALGADTAKIYSKNLDTSWLPRRRIARAQNEMSAVVSWVKSEETKTQLPQLLLPSLPAPQRENVAGAAAELDALIPVFESAPKEFAAAASTAFQLRERLDKAKAEAIKAKNPDYMGSPREALEEAEKIAKTLQQELEAVHRGIDVGDLMKKSEEVAGAVAKLRQSSATVDSDTIRGMREVVNTFREEVVARSKQVTDLAGAARRVSFVLRYFGALNTPGFANAPGKDEMKAMRGHLDLLGDDLVLLFGSHAMLSFDFFSELAKQINRQLDQRPAMETALGHETALVPPKADVLDYFRTLEKKSNNEVTDAYTAYAQAFFQHRIVVKLEDFDVSRLEEIFARPLSLAGLRPLVCTGYAVLGANLLIAAGAKTQEFIVAVRASAEQLHTHQLDEGHAVAVMNRKGATMYVSNDLVVHNVSDAIGPNAVAWTHKQFPLISGKGKTVQEATEALRVELGKH